MEEVMKLLSEERRNLNALIEENVEKASTKELSLLHNKSVMLGQIEAKVKEYNNI